MTVPISDEELANLDAAWRFAGEHDNAWKRLRERLRRAEEERDELRAEISSVRTELCYAKSKDGIAEIFIERDYLKERLRRAENIADAQHKLALAALTKLHEVEERLAAAEAVVEASWRIGIPQNNDEHAYDCGCCSCELDNAFSAYRAARGDKT